VPLTNKQAAAALAKLERGEDKPLVIRVSPRTRWSIKATASARRKTMKAFVLGLLKDAGVEIDPADLDE
jgi:uncharacterized protein (DUF1778 family)